MGNFIGNEKSGLSTAAVSDMFPPDPICVNPCSFHPGECSPEPRKLPGEQLSGFGAAVELSFLGGFASWREIFLRLYSWPLPRAMPFKPLATLQPDPFCRKIWRCSYQVERYLTIQSINARSKPISYPAFSLSIHLCRRISALSAKNSLYKDEFLTS